MEQATYLKILAKVVRPNGGTTLFCECVCGKMAWFNGARPFRSCGCLRYRLIGDKKRTHGKSHTPLYETWQNMWTRCTNAANEKYRWYGAIGITVCDRWKSFEAFQADMGERPKGKTLDRIDSAGNYYKENCRWATWQEQQNNRKNNTIVEYQGEKLPLAVACRRLGLKYSWVRDKLTRMTFEEAVNKAAIAADKGVDLGD